MFGRRSGDTLGSSRVETLLGEGTAIQGNIRSTGVVRIDGTLEGEIDHEGVLVVGPKGRLEAKVRARALAIAGEVRGDVVVDGKLELLPGASLRGDIRCAQLVIGEGALFEGRCHMDPPPQAEAAPARGPEAQEA